MAIWKGLLLKVSFVRRSEFDSRASRITLLEEYDYYLRPPTVPSAFLSDLFTLTFIPDTHSPIGGQMQKGIKNWHLACFQPRVFSVVDIFDIHIHNANSPTFVPIFYFKHNLWTCDMLLWNNYLWADIHSLRWILDIVGCM